MDAVQVSVCRESEVEDREREGASGRGADNREMAYQGVP